MLTRNTTRGTRTVILEPKVTTVGTHACHLGLSVSYKAIYRSTVLQKSAD